jgi:hypothetical protein
MQSEGGPGESEAGSVDRFYTEKRGSKVGCERSQRRSVCVGRRSKTNGRPSQILARQFRLVSGKRNLPCVTDFPLPTLKHDPKRLDMDAGPTPMRATSKFVSVDDR